MENATNESNQSKAKQGGSHRKSRGIHNNMFGRCLNLVLLQPIRWLLLRPWLHFTPGEHRWHCESHVFWLLQCFQHNPTITAQGEAGRSCSQLPHKQTAVCDCVWPKFSNDTAIVGRVEEGNNLEYRKIITQLSQLVWTEPPVHQRQQDKGGGDRFQEEGSSDYTGEHQGFGHWDHGGVQIPGCSHKQQTGLDTRHRMSCIRRAKVVSICWGDEVLWCVQDTVKNLLWLCGSISDILRWSAGAVEAQRGTGRHSISWSKGAGSVLDCPLDSIEEVGERRMLAKLTSIMDNPSHPLHDTVGALSSSFSNRLLHPWCKKERYRRSFIPTAVGLFNTNNP